ncbi:hypothetical protein D9M68_561880 [compost metagenome]
MGQQRATETLAEKLRDQAEIEDFHGTIGSPQQLVVAGNRALVVGHPGAVVRLLDQLPPLLLGPGQLVRPGPGLADQLIEKTIELELLDPAFDDPQLVAHRLAVQLLGVVHFQVIGGVAVIAHPVQVLVRMDMHHLLAKEERVLKRRGAMPTVNEQNPHRQSQMGVLLLKRPVLVAPGAGTASTVALANIRRGCRGAELTAPEFQRRLARLWRAEPVTHRVTTLVETQLVIPCLGGSPQAQRLQGR